MSSGEAHALHVVPSGVQGVSLRSRHPGRVPVILAHDPAFVGGGCVTPESTQSPT